MLVIEGPLSREAAPELCERLKALADTSPVEVVVCDVGAVTAPGLGAIEALARLHVTARRHGRCLHLRNTPAALRELLDLTGLLHVVPLGVEPLGVEPLGQPEHREEPLGVEEGVEADDPSV